MTINSSSNYWISPTALTITLNANGDKDYIQANVAGGAMIMCYMPGIDGLGFDNGHNYQRWQLVANPTYFNSETEKFVYVAIPRTRKADNDVALVVFPSEKIDVYGKNTAEEQLGSADYYYIYLQGIISASVVNGEEHERVWTAHIETGTLSSDEALTAGGDNTWWRLNIVDQTVSFLKEVLSATIRDLTSTFVRVTNLVFPSGTITGVANNDTPHDSQMDIVTPEFLFGNTDARFVRRDIDDKLNNFLTFLQGIHFGEDFQQSLSGAGIYKDDKGQWHIEGDILHARRKLTAEEVEVMNTSHIKGKVVNSAGGFVISRIEKVSGAWRCYFRQQDAEGRRVYNSMRVDDLALCETFNLVDNNGQAANHYWHRRVTSVGTDYVDVADNTQADDYASGSDEPQVGDEVAQLGNITDKDRQSAIIQSAAGEGAPYFKIIKGINSFTLPRPIFLFDKQNFEIRVENPANRGEYIRLQDFLESMQGRINAVQQQADKQLVIWFGDAVPSLTNAPANDWTDDTTKELHLHDIYYNRSYAETGGGRAYSFEKNPDNTYSWHEITDADVLKSLEAAKQAQDTADGKRRVFVKVQPTPPYDEGDQWANATYDTEYQNDLLVCVKPKKKGEAFDIADWQSAQAYTTKKFEAQLEVSDKTIDAAIRDLRTGLESVGMHLDGENSMLTLVANKTRMQAADGTESAVFNADGTIDARHIIAQGTEDRIEYGIIDGRANLIIKDKQGNTMLLLNRNGIVLPTDITAYARRKAFTMTVKEASDGVYVSVLISLTLFVRNTGFERSTFGNNIRIEVDVPILGIKDLVVPVGMVEAAGQGKTLNVDETGEILYVTTWDKQYKVGTPIPLTPEFDYRVLWRNKVIDKGTGEMTRMHEGS